MVSSNREELEHYTFQDAHFHPFHWFPVTLESPHPCNLKKILNTKGFSTSDVRLEEVPLCPSLSCTHFYMQLSALTSI